MAQQSRDIDQRHAGRQQFTCERMPEPVRVRPGDSCDLEQPLESSLPIGHHTLTLPVARPKRIPQTRARGDRVCHFLGHRNAHQLAGLLVQGAHYIWGPFGEDSDLRRWGQKLSARGGKNAKKRAVVAVARKLAVLLHRLWVSGEVYEPLRNSQKAMNAAA
jgi:hypothetical protein